jgi:hypothetical protein
MTFAGRNIESIGNGSGNGYVDEKYPAGEVPLALELE